MSNRMVNVGRDALALLMTCPICQKLFRDATTVVECLHTFCKKCIYKKLRDEEMKSCPVCKVELGCAPLDKLRADHNVQDLRGKIFPCKMRNVEGHEIETQLALTSKRKERSLSSLVISNPKAPSQKGEAQIRVQSIAAPSRGSNKELEISSKKGKKPMEDNLQNSSTPQSTRPKRKPNPIWLSLSASKKRKATALLPQISPSYLRIKDGNTPVSYVQNYLKTKLKLKADNEVEIKCKGRLLSPSLKLNNLVDMWLQTSPLQSEYIKIGSLGEDFMIVVGYARKI